MFENIQSLLLEQVKQRVDARLSYVDELAELLDISRDSVYRRIRGETELSLTEAAIICREFGISLNELEGLDTGMYTFRAQLVNKHSFNLYNWMQSILEYLELINNYPGEKQLVYYTKDLPVFYYFAYAHLSAFKSYFWMRTLYGHDEYSSGKYSISVIPNDMVALGRRIWEKFCKVPSLEIWGLETNLVTLKQVEYCHECGYFNSPEEAALILDEYEMMISDLRSWIGAGRKPNGSTLEIYRNDILIGDNTILFRMDDQRVVFIPVSILSLLSTRNRKFTEHIDNFINTMVKRAVQISSTGEKERNRFFNESTEYLAKVRERILGS